jgi:hypothetical protein
MILYCTAESRRSARFPGEKCGRRVAAAPDGSRLLRRLERIDAIVQEGHFVVACKCGAYHELAPPTTSLRPAA